MTSLGYFNHTRRDLLALVPKGVQQVLEVGCGAGGTAQALKDLGVTTLIGIEPNAQAAEQAGRRFERVLVGPVEQATAALPSGEFDLILYGDVLEHLVAPWDILRAHRRLLKPHGAILLSVPNVRHWRLLLDLVFRGRWTYREGGGTLDRTHLRFFAKADLLAMVLDAGYRPVTEGHNEFGPLAKWADRLSLGLFRDFLVWQYFLLARVDAQPAGEGR